MPDFNDLSEEAQQELLERAREMFAVSLVAQNRTHLSFPTPITEVNDSSVQSEVVITRQMAFNHPPTSEEEIMRIDGLFPRIGAVSSIARYLNKAFPELRLNEGGASYAQELLDRMEHEPGETPTLPLEIRDTHITNVPSSIISTLNMQYEMAGGDPEMAVPTASFNGYYGPEVRMDVSLLRVLDANDTNQLTIHVERNHETAREDNPVFQENRYHGFEDMELRIRPVIHSDTFGWPEMYLVVDNGMGRTTYTSIRKIRAMTIPRDRGNTSREKEYIQQLEHQLRGVIASQLENWDAQFRTTARSMPHIRIGWSDQMLKATQYFAAAAAAWSTFLLAKEKSLMEGTGQDRVFAPAYRNSYFNMGAFNELIHEWPQTMALHRENSLWTWTEDLHAVANVNGCQRCGNFRATWKTVLNGFTPGRRRPVQQIANERSCSSCSDTMRWCDVGEHHAPPTRVEQEVHYNEYSGEYDAECVWCATGAAGDAVPILNYSHRPSFTFYETPEQAELQAQEKLFMGIEIEMEVDTASTSLRQVQRGWLAEIPLTAGDGNDTFFYPKDDSSISTGFELCTNPFTPDWGYNNFPFDHFDEGVHRNLFLEQPSSCGQHIHVSRSSFTSDHLTRFLLLHGHAAKFVQAVGGRFDNSFARWDTVERIMKDKNQLVTSGNSYPGRHAVNMGRNDTVELRYPAGVASGKLIRKNIEWVDALYSFTQTLEEDQEDLLEDPGYLMFWIASSPERYSNLQSYIDMLYPRVKEFEVRN